MAVGTAASRGRRCHQDRLSSLSCWLRSLAVCLHRGPRKSRLAFDHVWASPSSKVDSLDHSLSLNQSCSPGEEQAPLKPYTPEQGRGVAEEGQGSRVLAGQTTGVTSIDCPAPRVAGSGVIRLSDRLTCIWADASVLWGTGCMATRLPVPCHHLSRFVASQCLLVTPAGDFRLLPPPFPPSSIPGLRWPWHPCFCPSLSITHEPSSLYLGSLNDINKINAPGRGFSFSGVREREPLHLIQKGLPSPHHLERHF